ncbi:low molecular weight phosphatase family protein [Microbacterium sp. KRD172]|uniref:arsenate reductase/protein-tyrosine-phosphatase family protein n=1 Tax=Microbacterium sp. KRD172 TaxID=2729727 RepID=UPI0019D23750|nr:low molecular weight phosphatase family protein [Microbacterium sp. KRD172]
MIFSSSDSPPPGVSRREWRRRIASETPQDAPVQARPSQADPQSNRVQAGQAPDVQDAAQPSAPHALTILTVCTGNICRSPMAEVLLRARLEPLGVRVHSAGTHALVDHEMTGPAQALALESGARTADAAAHAARYLVEPYLLDADLVLAMAREHRSYAVKMVPSRMRRTFTVREFARLASTLGTDQARAAAEAAGADPKARLAAVLQAVTDQRGLVPTDPEDDDVIDPYRRSQETYAKSAAQLIPALDEVERVVRGALG